MIAALQFTAAALIVCTAAFVICLKLAKPGWEDPERGFMHGEPDEYSDYDGDGL